MKNKSRLPIFLIGPSDGIGRSVAKKLAAELQVPWVDLLELSEEYSKEIGFKRKKLDKAGRTGKLDGVYRYLLPYAAHSIKRGIEQHSNSVIRLGALQSTIDDDEILTNVIDILTPYKVILLLPSQDADDSTWASPA